MANCFEDELTDIQSEYISLCLEYSGEGVDKVYAYIYQTPNARMFNAFYLINGQIKAAGQLETDVDCDEFLAVGRDDISKIIDVCKKFDREIPNEMKLVYDINTHGFDAKMSYEAYEDKTPFEVFLAWLRSEK